MSVLGLLIFIITGSASIYPLARLCVWFEGLGRNHSHEGTQS